MDGLSLHAFNGLSGAHMARIPCESASWSDVINESGHLSATVPYSAIDLDAIARPYYTILAVIGFGRVLHAGYLLQAKNNRDSKSRQFTAGGGPVRAEEAPRHQLQPLFALEGRNRCR